MIMIILSRSYYHDQDHAEDHNDHQHSPARTCMWGYWSLMKRIMLLWNIEFPWDESITTTSTPAWDRAASLSLSLSLVPIAAPTSNCFLESLEARGNSRFFFRSVCAIRETSSPLSLMMGSFAFLLFRRIALTSCNLQPACATTSSSRGVITSDSGLPYSSGPRKSMSRDVTMPINWLYMQPFSAEIERVYRHTL